MWAPYCVAKLTSMTLIDLQLRWRQIRRLIVFVETPQPSLESLFTLLYGTITFLTCQSFISHLFDPLLVLVSGTLLKGKNSFWMAKIQEIFLRDINFLKFRIVS